jgi:hypothetical protein
LACSFWIGAQQQIFRHRQIAEDAAALRNQCQSPLHDLVCRKFRQIMIREPDPFARQRRHDAGDGFQERRLAGPVGAEDDHDFSAVDVQGHVGQGAMLAIGHRDIRDLKHRLPLQDRLR